MALPAPCNNWICEFNEDDIAEWLIHTPVTCVTCTYNSVIYPPGAIKDCRRQPTGLLTDACYNEVCMPPVTMTGPGTFVKVGIECDGCGHIFNTTTTPATTTTTKATTTTTTPQTTTTTPTTTTAQTTTTTTTKKKVRRRK